MTDLGVPAVPCPHVYFGEIESHWSLHAGAQALMAADLDGDALRDLVVTQDQSEVVVLRNRGRDPTAGGKAFDPPAGIERSNSRGIAVTDWNGDGRPELVGRSNHLLLLENKGDLVFEVIDKGVEILHLSDHIHVADMDGDGREDIIVYGGAGISIYPTPDGNGVLGEPFSLDLGQVGLRRGDVGDLDGDGNPDIVVAGFGGVPLLLAAFGDGAGGLERVTQYERPDMRGSEAVVVDVDVDGILDVLVTLSTMEPSVERYLEREPRLVWMRGTGGGELEEAAVIELPGGAVGFTVDHADLDGNGSPEIVALAGGYTGETGENTPGAYHLLALPRGGPRARRAFIHRRRAGPGVGSSWTTSTRMAAPTSSAPPAASRYNGLPALRHCLFSRITQWSKDRRSHAYALAWIAEPRAMPDKRVTSVGFGRPVSSAMSGGTESEARRS